MDLAFPDPEDSPARSSTFVAAVGAVETLPAEEILDPRVRSPGGPEVERPHGASWERRRGRRRHRHNRGLVDALTRPQRLSLVALMVSWGALTIWAWTWFLQPVHWTSPVTLAINIALLSVEMLALPLWFFFWIWRMKRPNPALTVPEVRTAIIVTKAPSEPWAVVRETLEAMLAQDFPFPYDTWLADESPQPETLSWCAAHGVRVSTREGVDAYHQPTWPRRTRCKEGNLAFFYDMWGYDHYDVVAQLDADHVPEPDYLSRMVIPFVDPMVGYVAAPSICDRNAARSWSARGRLYTEAVLHGPTQAGHSGGFAPSCIGSHYAVRTEALREIGGLGPELAEDFTTTLMMSSYRWQGVFAVDAEAHGDGPETVTDCVTQEFQWSRSMMNVLLGVGTQYRRGLSRRAKIRLEFCQWWYPLFATLMLASVLIPIVAIATQTPFVRVSLGGFYLHFGPPTLVMLATVVWLRSLKWLRPRAAKALSWEIALFQIVRWPWALFGCAQATAGRLARREFNFKVTPKGRTGPIPLPMRVVAPYLVLALASATPALLGLDAGQARGYYTLALINVCLYLTAASAIIALHIHEHPRGLRANVLRSSMGNIVATAATAAIVIAAVTAPGFILAPLTRGVTPSRPAAAVGHATTPLAIGVTTAALAANSTTAWVPADLGQVTSFERTIGSRVGIIMWFADWAHAKLEPAQLRAVAGRGAIPEISWEPWDYARGLRTAQPQYSLSSIIDGRHDAYIRSWAIGLRAYGGPVLLRFAQETNGSWYPWCEGVNGNRAGQYAQAWRHVHAIFAAEHVANVEWVWSPVSRIAIPINLSQYPGNGYVDVLGVSGFNGGTALQWTGWQGFSSLFDATLATLHRLAPHKPIQISEVSSAEKGGSKAAWITAMFGDLRRHRQVTSVIWFDLRKQTDWRVNSSTRAGQAFATGVAALRSLR